MSKVAIIGDGFVGMGMRQIFPDAYVVDPPKRSVHGYEVTADCDLSIICVPTPMAPDGSCDTSIVKAVAAECRSPLVLIKSTVTPGTTQMLNLNYSSSFCFSPEYMGESRYWTPPEYPDPRSPLSHRFMIVGGNERDCSRIADIFLPVLGPATRFRFMSSTEAEIVKYAENSFFALKVTFANELRRICEAGRANYHTVREGWLDDPRVGPMHSVAFADKRGFDGKCLPKDIEAFASVFRALGIKSKLLEAVIAANEQTTQP